MCPVIQGCWGPRSACNLAGKLRIGQNCLRIHAKMIVFSSLILNPRLDEMCFWWLHHDAQSRVVGFFWDSPRITAE